MVSILSPKLRGSKLKLLADTVKPLVEETFLIIAPKDALLGSAHDLLGSCVEC